MLGNCAIIAICLYKLWLLQVVGFFHQRNLKVLVNGLGTVGVWQVPKIHCIE